MSQPRPPDAPPAEPDEPDAPPADPAEPDAPAAAVDPCPIDQSQVRVDFPFVAPDVPTVVTTVGSCYHSLNGMVSQGWDSATLLQVIEDDGTPALALQNLAGAYFYFDFIVDQRAPSSGEQAALASTTGIPASFLGGPASRLTTDFSSQPVPHDALPDGVSVQAFFPTSDGDTSYLRFASDADHMDALAGLMDGLAGGDLLVDVTMVEAFGVGRRYQYTFDLTDQQSPRLRVSAIAVLP